MCSTSNVLSSQLFVYYFLLITVDVIQTFKTDQKKNVQHTNLTLVYKSSFEFAQNEGKFFLKVIFKIDQKI